MFLTEQNFMYKTNIIWQKINKVSRFPWVISNNQGYAQNIILFARVFVLLYKTFAKLCKKCTVKGVCEAHIQGFA